MNYKTVLITGGTGLIGFEMISHFLKLPNYKVVFISRSQTKISTVIDNIPADKKIFLHGICIDLEKENSSAELVEYLEKNEIFPDILINNARNANYLKLDENGKAKRDDFQNEFLMNVVVPYEISIALSAMKNSKLCNIINISSIYGIVAPNPNLYDGSLKRSPIQYGVTKSALIHLTKELAVRFADKKIRVNALSLGGVEGRVNDEFIKKYAKLCPQEKMLKSEDIIGAVEFLASDSSSGMTGHNLVVDGGWTAW
ncbi:MAG: SDR family oxidoreductase [bacterium]